jgi:O-antigen/teichoic acid export membrane protein
LVPLINIFKKFYHKIRLDRSIVFTILGRLVQSVGMIITLLLVTSALTKHEQGYFYTFTAILALQVFAELGLAAIVMQYVAHEAAHLSWDGSELTGDDYHRSRLSSLVRWSSVWFMLLAVLLVAGLWTGGMLYFSEYNDDLPVAWRGPWILLVISNSVLLIAGFLTAIIEGLGKIKEMAKLRLVQQILSTATLALCLATGFKLFSSGLAILISSVAVIILLATSGHIKILISIMKVSVTGKIDYVKEMFPYHYKIGLGNVASYLIYTLISPILFATQGAVVAGQMGATQTLLNGVLTISLSWFSTKNVVFSNLVATRRFDELNRTYKETLSIATIICVVGVAALVAFIVLMPFYFPQSGDRFLPLLPTTLFAFVQITSVVGNGQAYYLRSFKREPFFIPSVSMGLLSALATTIASRYYSVTEISICYFLVNGVLGFLWGCIIFSNKTQEWTGYRQLI